MSRPARPRLTYPARHVIPVLFLTTIARQFSSYTTHRPHPYLSRSRLTRATPLPLPLSSFHMVAKKTSVAVYPHGVSLTGAIFVPWPHLRGHYMKTHPCVASVKCPYCGSQPGIPCLGASSQYKCEPHYTRKDEHAYKLGIRKRPVKK